MLKKHIYTVLILLLTLSLSVGCGGVHRFDDSQVPRISIRGENNIVIKWTPPTAYQINIYEGTQDGDGIGEIWNKGRLGGYENKLQSPVVVDFPLQKGKTYTVTVQRKDLKGSGSGFTNTRRRYVGKKTFIAK